MLFIISLFISNLSIIFFNILYYVQIFSEILWILLFLNLEDCLIYRFIIFIIHSHSLDFTFNFLVNSIIINLIIKDEINFIRMNYLDLFFDFSYYSIHPIKLYNLDVIF